MSRRSALFKGNFGKKWTIFWDLCARAGSEAGLVELVR